MNRVYYAIGDIHGELARLQALHAEIQAYHAERHADLDKMLIHLGDYVDRGPDSAGVLDLLVGLSHRPDVICLKGNHEVMMVDALRNDHRADWWRSNGGDQTLASYEAQARDYQGAGHQIEGHLDWIDALPTYLHIPDRKLYYVHAAIDPDGFPDVDAKHHLWGRSEAFFNSGSWTNPALDGYTIVHGHTPTDGYRPDVSDDRRRINIDTGAVYGGRLTAVALAPGWPPGFLSV